MLLQTKNQIAISAKKKNSIYIDIIFLQKPKCQKPINHDRLFPKEKKEKEGEERN